MLVVGDSLSAGYGLSDGSGWVELLQKRVGASERIVNASISGETTAGGVTRIARLLERHQPGLVVIELGGNDGLRGVPLAATERNLDAMVGAASQAGAHVLLLQMRIPPNLGPEYSAQFEAIYPRVAERHGAVLVPFFLEQVARDPELMQSDALHPNERAQPIMLDAVWPYLSRWLPAS